MDFGLSVKEWKLKVHLASGLQGFDACRFGSMLGMGTYFCYRIKARFRILGILLL